MRNRAGPNFFHSRRNFHSRQNSGTGQTGRYVPLERGGPRNAAKAAILRASARGGVSALSALSPSKRRNRGLSDVSDCHPRTGAIRLHREKGGPPKVTGG